MFSSTILDVATALTFVFFAVSLAASSILEAVAGIISWRSGSLLKGVKDLLNDQKFTGLAVQLYQHALINPRNDGVIGQDQAGTAQQLLSRKAPSYIDPAQFANALIDILNTGKPPEPAGPHPGSMNTGDQESIDKAIDYVVPARLNPQINALLRGMSRRAKADINEFEKSIAAWFDNAMDRVSGVYKRWTQLWNLLIALGLAILLNISALHVASVLWKQPNVAKAAEGIKPTNDKDPIAAIRLFDTLRLPIGWCNYNLPAEKKSAGAPDPAGKSCQAEPKDSNDYLEMFVGWLITAAAALFGAPFWFDLLQSFVRLKGAGPSPDEKKTNRAAAA
jgi:hypothetical protein